MSWGHFIHILYGEGESVYVREKACGVQRRVGVAVCKLGQTVCPPPFTRTALLEGEHELLPLYIYLRRKKSKHPPVSRWRGDGHGRLFVCGRSLRSG